MSYYRECLAKRVLKEAPNKAVEHTQGFKTSCTSSVLSFLGIEKRSYKYSQTLGDVLNILGRNGYSYRSRLSSISKDSSVGAARGQIGKFGAGFYLVHVSGHVLLLDASGNTVVDTSPRQRDRRTIQHLYKITVKQ